MTQAERTAGPWELDGFWMSEGKPVAADICGPSTDDDLGETIATEVTIANARFIVTACNAHDELVAALRKALNYIENTEAELGIKLSSGDDARAVLSKLEGK